MHILAYLLFVFAQSLTVLYLGAAAFGFFYGSMATLFTALIGDLFGRRHAGAHAGVDDLFQLFHFALQL